MVICCDTSFLFSVYGNDGNTENCPCFFEEHTRTDFGEPFQWI